MFWTAAQGIYLVLNQKKKILRGVSSKKRILVEAFILQISASKYSRNLASRAWVPYCASMTKRATLERSVTINYGYRLDFDWCLFNNINRNERKLNTIVSIEPQLGGRPIFSDVQSDLVARFLAAGKGERMHWERSCELHNSTVVMNACTQNKVIFGHRR